MKIPKKIYVVFDSYLKEVSFITTDKDIVDAFFKRESRKKSYFFNVVKDKEHIIKFMRDFPDKEPEISGSTVMLDYEYLEMSDAIPSLLIDLSSTLEDLISDIQYLKFTDDELYGVMSMFKIINERINFDPDFLSDMDEIFDNELIMLKYLDDVGV